MKNKITENLVKNLPIQEKEYFVWDTELKGLGVRVYASGNKVFFLKHITNGKPVKEKLGQYPVVNVALARNIASQYKLKLTTGHYIESPKQEKQLSFKDFIEQFKREHYPYLRKKTIEMYDGNLKKMQNLYTQNIKNITAEMILSCVDTQKPISYNRYLACIKKLFNFAIEHDLLDKNPAQKLKKFREEKREVYLSKEEVERLFTALNQSEHKIQACLIKLIIFTGSRSGEVKSICWSEVDLEKGVWMRHASKVKGKKTVSVPFNQMALAVLKEMQDSRQEGVDYIFINPKTRKPFESNKTFWKTLCKKLNLKNVRIHDLRHTFASLLINNNINLEIVSKLLGHSDVKITQRYAHLNTNSLQTATNMIDEIFRKKD